MEILKSISALGQTIVAVIHQPRYEIFASFDEVLLIVPGGRTAYLGPVARVKEYFVKVGGYEFDPLGNVADRLMDILTADAAALVGLWETSSREFFRETEEGPAADDPEALHDSITLLAKQRGANVFAQFYLCLIRYLLQQSRFWTNLILESFVALFAGGIMGIAASPAQGELFQGLPPGVADFSC